VALGQVYTGDGQDIDVTSVHARVCSGDPGTTCTANADCQGNQTCVDLGENRLFWEARTQPSSVDGYDLFRGSISVVNGDPDLLTLVCLEADLFMEDPPGTILERLDPEIPPPGVYYYYLVGHSSRAAGALDPVGKTSDGAIRLAPVCPPPP
jgi:hypothetical protein